MDADGAVVVMVGVRMLVWRLRGWRSTGRELMKGDEDN